MDLFWTYLSLYWIECLLVAALLGLIPAAIAKKKGKSFGLWWLYGWLLFIVAIIHALLLPESNDSNYETKQNTSKVEVQINPNASKESLIKRAKLFIEDEKWNEAEAYCNHILDLDPENAETYLLLALIENKVKSVDELSEKRIDIRNSAYYNKLQRFWDNQSDNTVEELISSYESLTEEDKNDQIYHSALELLEQNKLEPVLKGIDLLKSIPGYMFADDLVLKYEKRIPELETKDEKEKETQKKSKKLHIIIASIVVVVVASIASVLYFTDIERNMFTGIMPGTSENTILSKYNDGENYSCSVYSDEINVYGRNNNTFEYFGLKSDMISADIVNGKVSQIFWFTYSNSVSRAKYEEIQTVLEKHAKSVSTYGSGIEKGTEYKIKGKPYKIVLYYSDSLKSVSLYIIGD